MEKRIKEHIAFHKYLTIQLLKYFVTGQTVLITQLISSANAIILVIFCTSFVFINVNDKFVTAKTKVRIKVLYLSIFQKI